METLKKYMETYKWTTGRCHDFKYTMILLLKYYYGTLVK